MFAFHAVGIFMVFTGKLDWISRGWATHVFFMLYRWVCGKEHGGRMHALASKLLQVAVKAAAATKSGASSNEQLAAR